MERKIAIEVAEPAIRAPRKSAELAKAGRLSRVDAATNRVTGLNGKQHGKSSTVRAIGPTVPSEGRQMSALQKASSLGGSKTIDVVEGSRIPNEPARRCHLPPAVRELPKRRWLRRCCLRGAGPVKGIEGGTKTDCRFAIPNQTPQYRLADYDKSDCFILPTNPASRVGIVSR